MTGAGEESYGFDPHTYDKWHNNEQTSFGRQWKEGDVLGVRHCLCTTRPHASHTTNSQRHGAAGAHDSR
jgi:hypothetical protein